MMRESGCAEVEIYIFLKSKHGDETLLGIAQKLTRSSGRVELHES